MAFEHFTFAGLRRPAERTGDSDVAEVADGYRPRSCLNITAVVVQADALDKGGGEKERRRDGAEERWVLEKHRIVWCSKKSEK